MKTFISAFTLWCFLITSVIGTCPVYAQEFRLPAPGVRVVLSPQFNPPILKGIKVHPDNPFRFDFILDKGDVETPLMASLRDESAKLIKYFFASLTIPEKDLWVNLSPYEKDRIVPQSFGRTEMGRDLLAEDYMLKQITASLIYPEDEIGKKFWKRIYEEAARKFGTTNILVNTFNKVWIVPEKAVVYENAKAGTAYVVESKLKVMLEEDYLALEKNQRQPGDMFNKEQQNVSPSTLPSELGLNAKAPQGNPVTPNKDINALGSQIIREIVIPELTKEVNEGKNFAQLRQVYNSLILATWYKKKIKDSILAQVYTDKKKVAGVGYENSVIQKNPVILSEAKDYKTSLDSSPSAQNDTELSRLPSNEALNVKAPQGNPVNDVEAIYQRYLQAFKKGVYNYIKEDQDPITQEAIPRKYFSGGTTFDAASMALALSFTTDGAVISQPVSDQARVVEVKLDPTMAPDQAMVGQGVRMRLKGISFKDKQRIAQDIWEGRVEPVWGVNTDITVMIEIVKASRETSRDNIKVYGVPKPDESKTKFRDIFMKAFFNPNRLKDYPLLDWERLQKFGNPLAPIIKNEEDLLSRLHALGDDFTQYLHSLEDAREDDPEARKRLDQAVSLLREISEAIVTICLYTVRSWDDPWTLDITYMLSDPWLIIFGMHQYISQNPRVDSVREVLDESRQLAFMVLSVFNIYRSMDEGKLDIAASGIRQLNYYVPHYAEVIRREIIKLAQEGNTNAKKLTQEDLYSTWVDPRYSTPLRQTQWVIEGIPDNLMRYDIREAAGYDGPISSEVDATAFGVDKSFDQVMINEDPEYYRRAEEMRISRLDGQRMPAHFWDDRKMAIHSIWVTLDTIPGFQKARRENNIKLMKELYLNKVKVYPAQKGKYNGAVAFFKEVGGLGGFMNLPRNQFLAKKNSPAALLRFAIPGLIDLRNPDALDPLDVELNYWTDPENAKYHIYQALDSIDGFRFREAREKNDIKKMKELYLQEVKGYPGGQNAFFFKVGGLTSLMSDFHSYLAKGIARQQLIDEGFAKILDDKDIFDDISPTEVRLKRNPKLLKTKLQRLFPGNWGSLMVILKQSFKYDSSAALLRFALPGLIDLTNPDALDPLDVERYYWTDPANARYHIYQALDMIEKEDKKNGFQAARLRGDIKRMAELYKQYVIGYHTTKEKGRNGQTGFFYEIGGLYNLMHHPRTYFDNKNCSPAAMLRFALRGLIDDNNPDALHSVDVERNVTTPDDSAAPDSNKDSALLAPGDRAMITYQDIVWAKFEMDYRRGVGTVKGRDGNVLGNLHFERREGQWEGIKRIDEFSGLPPYPQAVVVRDNIGGTISLVRNFDAPLTVARVDVDGGVVLKRFGDDGKIVSEGVYPAYESPDYGRSYRDLAGSHVLKFLWWTTQGQLRHDISGIIERLKFKPVSGPDANYTGNNRLLYTHPIIQKRVLPGSVILDVGVSSGITSVQLAQAVFEKGVRVEAIDSNIEQEVGRDIILLTAPEVDQFMQEHPGYLSVSNVDAMDGKALPQEKYDFIRVSNLARHLNEREVDIMVKNLGQALKEGGGLLLTVDDYKLKNKMSLCPNSELEPLRMFFNRDILVSAALIPLFSYQLIAFA